MSDFAPHLSRDQLSSPRSLAIPTKQSDLLNHLDQRASKCVWPKPTATVESNLGRAE